MVGSILTMVASLHVGSVYLVIRFFSKCCVVLVVRVSRSCPPSPTSPRTDTLDSDGVGSLLKWSLQDGLDVRLPDFSVCPPSFPRCPTPLTYVISSLFPLYTEGPFYSPDTYLPSLRPSNRLPSRILPGKCRRLYFYLEVGCVLSIGDYQKFVPCWVPLKVTCLE